MADGNWPVLRYDDYEYELAHADDHSDPLVCVCVNGSYLSSRYRVEADRDVCIPER